MQTHTQPQDRSLETPSYQYLAPLAITSALMVGYKLAYHCSTSRNIGPQVVCGGDFVYFEIPQDTKRESFFGFGPETEVAQIEIELINRETKKRETFILTKEFPYKQCQIMSNKHYAFKWRTHEDGHLWSQYSKLKPLVSRSPFFTLSPGDPSPAKREELLRQIIQGPQFNALIFGKIGAGKSSFLNSLVSAIAGRYRHAAMTSPEGLTNTQSQTRYDIVPEKAYIYDMPGWESSFNLALLRQILEGRLDNITVDQLNGRSYDFQQTNSKHVIPRINVVILVMSALNLKENREFHKQITEFLKRLSIPCIGVVTKMDLIVSDENKPISRDRFFQDPRVIAKCQQIPLDVTYPLINYNPGETTKHEVDELLLHIIKTCQERSQSDSGRVIY